MIYSSLKTPKRKFTPKGNHYINTYQEQININGKLCLVKTGETNVYERIQEDAESCKIENILHAVAMGDLNALNQREATYCDATTMPKSLREAQDLVIRLRDEFYKMPIDVRKEFDNSPEKYVSLMGTEEFKSIMSPYNEKIRKIAEEKNHAEYEKKVKQAAKFNNDIAAEQAKGTKGGEDK